MGCEEAKRAWGPSWPFPRAAAPARSPALAEPLSRLLALWRVGMGQLSWRHAQKPQLPRAVGCFSSEAARLQLPWVGRRKGSWGRGGGFPKVSLSPAGSISTGPGRLGAEVQWASVCGPHRPPFSRLVLCQLQRGWLLRGRRGSWLGDPVPAGVGRVRGLTPALPPGGTAYDRPVTLAVLYLCICFPMCEIQDCALQRHNKSIHVCKKHPVTGIYWHCCVLSFVCELQPRVTWVPHTEQKMAELLGVSLDRPAVLGLGLGAGLWKCGVKSLWGWALLPDGQLLYWDRTKPESLLHSTLDTASTCLKRSTVPGWCLFPAVGLLHCPPWWLGLGVGAGVSSPSDSSPLSNYFLVFA